MNTLSRLGDPKVAASIEALVKPYLERLRSSSHWNDRLTRVLTHKPAEADSPNLQVDSAGTAVIRSDIGLPDDVESTALSLIPWRIGPLQINDLRIDSEWVSTVKWGAIEKFLGDVDGLRVVDVGASSGYFALRMLQHNPRLIVAVDPNERCYLQLALLDLVLAKSNFLALPLSLRELLASPGYFDVALCMGVLYHQQNPVEALGILKESVVPGGRVLIETLGVPGMSLSGLVVKGRYAKMRNVACIPTTAALHEWMVSSGLERVHVQAFGPITIHEQRRSRFAPYESLEDFLDPKDSSKTIEGHPAPIRIVGIGYRR